MQLIANWVGFGSGTARLSAAPGKTAVKRLQAPVTARRKLQDGAAVELAVQAVGWAGTEVAAPARRKFTLR